MREAMQEAGLSHPLFDSDRSKDMFVATFLFHHFLSTEDLRWLGNFKKYNLSDKQAKALIFLREVGAIDNSAYKNLNHVDTLTASNSLRQLRDLELLSVRNQSSATYYLPGAIFMDSLSKGYTPETKSTIVETKTPMVKVNAHMDENEQLIQELPKNLKNIIKNLGEKTTQDKMEEAILALCSWKEMTADSLASILKRKNIRELRRKYLSPLVERKLLQYKYPEMLKYPHQAYLINKAKKRKFYEKS